MKRCPECRRDYYDDTLSFCLSDGSPLVYGVSGDEPATAMLHATEPPVEPATQAQIHLSNEIAVLPAGSVDRAESNGLHRRLLVAAIVLISILIGGFVGYRYLTSAGSKQIESIAVMPFV